MENPFKLINRKTVRVILCLSFLIFSQQILPAQSIKYQLEGICFSPYKDGQSPLKGSVIRETQIDSLLRIIKPYTKWIRTYSSSHGLENTGRIAHSLGLKIAAGAHLSSDVKDNQIEINNLITAGKNGEIDIAVVGNEVINDRNEVNKKYISVEKLIDYIKQVKVALPNIPVTTGEIYTDYLKNPELISSVDLIFAHIYPFWEKESISCATFHLNNIYEKIKTNSNGKEIYIAETGWASCGYPQGRAIPDSVNASKYFLNFISWAKEKKVKYFYFEAFDESWKKDDEGTGMQGACWGIFIKNGGSLKWNMNRVFEGQTNMNNWIPDSTYFLSQKISIKFTQVPSRISNKWLEGIVTGVLPQNYKVAIYIQVSGGWWTKPTFEVPLTNIDCDGTFRCNIFTNVNDKKATSVCAKLLSNENSAPIMSGGVFPMDEEKIVISSVTENIK